MEKSENDAGSPPDQSETPDDSTKYTEVENVELLNSRLEEQTQLYMILKQSKEDVDAKCVRFEEENQALAKIRDEEEKKLKDTAKKVTKLVEQLKTMQLKHDDLMAIVRVCNKHNEELTGIKLATIERNNNLCQTAKIEAKEKIDKLTNTYMELRNQCAARDKMIREHRQSSESAKIKYRTILSNLKKTHKKDVQILVDYIQRVKISLLEKESLLEHEEEQLIFETPLPDELVKLEVKNKAFLSKVRKTDLQRTVEKSHTEQLKEVINNLEKKIKKLNATFEQQTAEVQANAEVQELQAKIKDAEMQLNKTQEEMETYKKESQETLNEEREINKTLRHIP